MHTSETLPPATSKLTRPQVYVTYIGYECTYIGFDVRTHQSKVDLVSDASSTAVAKVNARMKVDVCGGEFTLSPQGLTHVERRLRTLQWRLLTHGPASPLRRLFGCGRQPHKL